MENTNTQPTDGQFVFVCCQVGAERALKHDIAVHHPNLVFAFSRPGFVTFKRKDEASIDKIESPFARTFGFHLATIKGTSEPINEIASALRSMASNTPFRHLHVWTRDRAVPGERRFEPFVGDESLQFGESVKEAASDCLSGVDINHKARVGDRIADVIKVDDDNWFVGFHTASAIQTCWPGGVPPLKAKESMISRAYLKMEEALKWSRLPVQPGDLCVELGSSPGGSCQALLERGLHVIGVDPAIMDERVLSHPNFTHVRARAADLKRKEFANVRWLMTDAIITPSNTLDAVEHIVTNRRVNIPGMLLTLKLLDWKKAREIDSYLERIRGWGYRHVRVRQLAFNRREICVLAARSKGKMRIGFRRNSQSLGNDIENTNAATAPQSERGEA